MSSLVLHHLIQHKHFTTVQLLVQSHQYALLSNEETSDQVEAAPFSLLTTSIQHEAPMEFLVWMIKHLKQSNPQWIPSSSIFEYVIKHYLFKKIKEKDEKQQQYGKQVMSLLCKHGHVNLFRGKYNKMTRDSGLESTLGSLIRIESGENPRYLGKLQSRYRMNLCQPIQIKVKCLDSSGNRFLKKEEMQSLTPFGAWIYWYFSERSYQFIQLEKSFTYSLQRLLIVDRLAITSSKATVNILKFLQRIIFDPNGKLMEQMNGLRQRNFPGLKKIPLRWDNVPIPTGMSSSDQALLLTYQNLVEIYRMIRRIETMLALMSPLSIPRTCVRTCRAYSRVRLDVWKLLPGFLCQDIEKV